MSELGEAIEGAVALIGGGFIFLLFASAIGANQYFSFSLVGGLYMIVGLLLLVTIAAVLIGNFLAKHA